MSPKPNHLGPALATLLAGSMMTVMAGAIVAPALPQMNQAFVGQELGVKLVLTLPALFIALGSPLAGWLLDRWQKKLVLLASLLLYGLAGLSGYLVQDLTLILAGRAFLGLAVAGIMTSCTTLIADYLTGPQLHRFLGMQAGFMSYGGVVFLPLGGLLAGWGWQQPFLLYGFAWLVLPFAWALLWEPATPAPQASIQAETPAPFPWLAVGLLDFLALVNMLAFYLVPVQLPFFLSRLEGSSPTSIGLIIAIFPLVSGSLSLQFRRLSGRFSSHGISAFCHLLIGVGFLLLSQAQGVPSVLLALVVMGVGMGFWFPNLNLQMVALSPPAFRGRSLGIMSLSIYLGQFASPLLAQPLILKWGMEASFLATSLLLGLIGLGFLLTWLKQKK